MFSACCSSWLRAPNLDSLVTPSTSLATSAPKRCSMSSMRVVGVLGDVVQQRGLDGDRVEAQLGQRAGDGQRVRHVRLAARPPLFGVRLDSELERLADGLDVRLREVAQQLVLELLCAGVQGTARERRLDRARGALDRGRGGLGWRGRGGRRRRSLGGQQRFD